MSHLTQQIQEVEKSSDFNQKGSTMLQNMPIIRKILKQIKSGEWEFDFYLNESLRIKRLNVEIKTSNGMKGIYMSDNGIGAKTYVLDLSSIEKFIFWHMGLSKFIKQAEGKRKDKETREAAKFITDSINRDLKPQQNRK